ncbi:MAG: AMP-binding protein [Actinomycetota bacterium]|nr:AMP-binding protein [Actinomycetota bacterium]
MSSLRPVSGTAEEIVALLRDWVADDRAAPLVVETSGSTGEPKRVMLSRRAMLASANATHARLGGAGQWLLTLPPSYVAGVQVVVRSLLAGRDPVLGEVTDIAKMHTGRRYLSLVPTQLHRALDDATQVGALRGFDTVLLGGAATDPRLRTRAEALGVRVVATYGMSETCGGCVYDGRPLDGVVLEIGPSGRVRVRGEVLFDGYEGDPGLTAAVMDGDWFVTSDLGQLDNGQLSVQGRADDVVISGGVNVPAPLVAHRLRQHPVVVAAEIVGVTDAEWGERVVAFVVGALSLQQAREWVSAEQPRQWAPQCLVEVEEIPLLDNGKVDRVRLQELAG